MNKEQAKHLKEGDKILIEAIFNQIDDDGDAVVGFANSVSDYECGFIATKHIVGAVIETQPNKPKYDPCRPFKQGDEVRVLEERHGRKAPVCGAIFPGKIYTVSDDEKDGDVMLRTGNCGHDCISWDWLELVTPVEELAPYTLEEETAYIDDEECGMLHIYYNYNGGRDKVRTFYENGPESWNATKAAAEAECDRLNAEYRKGKE